MHALKTNNKKETNGENLATSLKGAFKAANSNCNTTVAMHTSTYTPADLLSRSTGGPGALCALCAAA